jgi:5-methyltetrahydrofolate--homocysteine methyltransferase
MNDILHRRLAERRYLLADGATGTNLFAMGLQTGEPPELWNVDHPERVAANHRGFIEAGADIILTNSFGGNRYRLALHGNAHRVAELNEAAARIARAEADRKDPAVIVAGSMGPSGEIYQPLGTLSVEEAREAFREQAEALVRGGADILWVETVSSREEMQAAVEGAAATGKPVVCTLSFDTNGRTMMGLCPADIALFAAGMTTPPTACGSNCGVGAAETVLSVLNMARAATAPLLLVAKGNCGIPHWCDGAIRYDGTPELMAAYARHAFAAGARIIGGCCGTTPAHLRAMKQALEADCAAGPATLEQIVADLGEISSGARAQYGGDLTLGGGSASGAAPRRGKRTRA